MTLLQACVAGGLAAVVVVMAVGCSESAPVDAAPPPIVVAATNPPLASFASRILGVDLDRELDRAIEVDGERVEILAATPPGLDPQTWFPDDETIAAVQIAPVILLQGPGAGPWGEAVPLPRRGRVDTTRTSRDRFPEGLAGIRHRHGGGEEHTHGGNSAYAWLDFEIARRQARAVRDALVAALPQREALLDGHWRALDAELLALHAQAAAIAEAAPPLLAFHPVYPFLAEAYGLSIASVDWDPAEAPSAAEWDAFDLLANEHGAQLMLWPSPPHAEIREGLSARGIAIVEFDPGAVAPADGTPYEFTATMRRNLEALAAAIAAPPASPPLD